MVSWREKCFNIGDFYQQLCEQLDWTTGMSFGKSLTLDASLIANVAQLETLDKNGKKQPTKMTEHTTQQIPLLLSYSAVLTLFYHLSIYSISTSDDIGYIHINE